MANRTYKGEAPGDSPILNKPSVDTYIEDPILKIIILEVFPMIIAVFIVFMFLVVTISGTTLVVKSIYLYRIRPWTRKKIKIYKRYRRKLHTDEANSSTSSESDDSDAIAAEILDKFEAEINRKNTQSSISMNATAFRPRRSVIVSTAENSPEPGGQQTGLLKKQPSQTRHIPGSRMHIHSHNRPRRSHSHGQGHRRQNDTGLSQSSFVPLDQRSGTSLLNPAPVTTVRKPIRIKRTVPATLMPEGYRHLRHDTPGPAQIAFAASPDFKGYDPVNDVWQSSSTDEDWPRNIIIIPKKRTNKNRKN